MSVLSEPWTRERVLLLPEDGRRYELVDGELLVSPSPRRAHQHAVGNLYRRLYSYLQANPVGTAAFSPADLDLRSGQLVQPDLFVERLTDGQGPAEWSDVGIPLLIVEILSPTTAKHDRFTKRRLYQRSGVPAYWVVDLDARLVEVWTPGSMTPQVARARLEWRPDGAAAPLVIDLAEYFGQVWRA